MYKKIFAILVSLIFILGINGLAGAEQQEELIETQKVVNVGNKICPVSGEEIKEETKATYEHEGKIYNFCCAMCIEEFKKDPEQYIQKVEEEIDAESEEEKSEMPQEEVKENEEMVPPSQTSESMHEGHHH